jgi:hypothetical protein
VHSSLLVLIDLVQADVVLAIAGVTKISHDQSRYQYDGVEGMRSNAD